jgi:broad-specificity NMP kinase
VSEAVIDACLRSGNDVIVDKAISNLEVISRFTLVAKKYSALVYEFVLNGSKEVVIKRAEERGYREGSLLTPAKLEKFWEDTQEYLEKRKDVLEVNTDILNKEEVFQLILNKINAV